MHLSKLGRLGQDQVQVAGGRSGRMLDCVAALMQMRFRQSWVEKRISLLRELH